MAAGATRLHYFPESGNSYKLALMLRLCGVAFEGVWTDFGSGVTRTADWRASVNQMGEIPVLEWQGRSLTQTGPILLRLAEAYGRFGAINDDDRYAILRWLFWDNHKLSGYMAVYRYLRAFTPSPDEHVLGFLRKRIDDCLRVAERHFETRRFAIGDAPSVADLSMVGYLLFPSDEAGYDLERSHPAVVAWLDRVRQLDGWQAPYDLLPGQRLRRYR
ncbi:glutathione S-transferase family protein [Rhodopseudomonas sp. B29]|uniref:glutathione S-transferase family protein n=1 Tax=Rhodopseudomonas sp. B29 TaxID=95607 RepID=UPI00034945FA|nr:glutathione S-transferase family protein [Rhodopseudomonas sp. B29]